MASALGVIASCLTLVDTLFHCLTTEPQFAGGVLGEVAGGVLESNKAERGGETGGGGEACGSDDDWLRSLGRRTKSSIAVDGRDERLILAASKLKR